MKKLLLAAAALAALPTSANAAVKLELGLGLDASGSIGSSNFNLQRQAYINVLSDPNVIAQDGSIAIGIYRFASSTTTILPVTVIDAASIASLVTALNNMAYTGGGTNIGSAIDTATADIFGNAIASDRQIIDISTDGFGTLGSSTTNALAAGIDQINCIGIGSNANCNNVVAGTGAFQLNATSFADFEKALRLKVAREVGAVPEPGTWAMMLLGFFGLGFAMRSSTANRVRTQVSYS